MFTATVSIRKEMKSEWVISGFRHHVNETCALFITQRAYIKEILRNKLINSDTISSMWRNQMIL
jgi:hypothetical protein